MKTRKIRTPCTAIIPPLGQLTLGPREIFVGFRKIVTRRLAHNAALYQSGGLAASTLSATPRSAATSRACCRSYCSSRRAATRSGTEKSRCRVGREVTRPGPSPDPDERISRIRLFRRCGSWLYVSTPFTSSGDTLSNVSALGMVLF